MKPNIFIFHGTEGYPEENWFPWLKKKLEEKGYKVAVPQFPTPEGQSLQAWLDVFKNYESEMTEDSVFVGHSLGGVFLLRLLERFKKPVKAAFFTGTPIGIQPLKNYESDSRFSGFDWNWPVIRKNAKHFDVFQSDDDIWVPLANGEQLAKELGVELTFIPNAGHFNKAAGYTEFPALLEKMEKVL